MTEFKIIKPEYEKIYDGINTAITHLLISTEKNDKGVTKVMNILTNIMTSMELSENITEDINND